VLAALLFGPAGVIIGVAVNVVVVFVVAEAAPKTWALQHSERAAILTAPLVQLVGRVLRLLARGLIGVANVILPGKGLRSGPFVTEEEIIALAGEAAEAGGIEESERRLIESIIRFGDTVAREIMVPRTDMVAMQADYLTTDMVEVAILNGLSRFPVYGEGVDDVVGVVYAKDLVRAERDGGGNQPVRALMREAFFVPETKKVSELLSEMQVNNTHMAIVVDEYGGTAGLVTLEDLLEELVGDITDEFDTGQAVYEVVSGEEVVLHDPTMNVDDFNEECSFDLPEGDWDSVGGLVFSELGRVPEVGDTVEVDGARLVVERMEGRRVGTLRIHRLAPTEASGPEAEEPADA
jgi:CBS domain containing-hemolysin-like protein